MRTMETISNYNQLVEYLKNNSDARFDEFNSKIVNSNIPTIGCTVPFVRKLSKTCSLDFVLSLPVNQYVEVDLLRGIVIANANFSFAAKSAMLLDFAKTIENWAVCDCSAIKPNPREKSNILISFAISLQAGSNLFAVTEL